jgi:hypothetical protein
MPQLSVAAGAETNKPRKQDLRNIESGLPQLRANNTKPFIAGQIVIERRVVCPYTKPAPQVTRVTSASYVSGVLMKKTLATLLVAGALATAGMSASAAISAAAGTSGQSSVAIGWWPDSTKK